MWDTSKRWDRKTQLEAEAERVAGLAGCQLYYDALLQVTTMKDSASTWNEVTKVGFLYNVINKNKTHIKIITITMIIIK